MTDSTQVKRPLNHSDCQLIIQPPRPENVTILTTEIQKTEFLGSTAHEAPFDYNSHWSDCFGQHAPKAAGLSAPHDASLWLYISCVFRLFLPNLSL